MSIVKRGGLALLLLVTVTALATGCVSRAGTINTGWTTVAADATTTYAALPNGKVVALDATSGGIIWEYPVPQEGSSSGGLGKVLAPPSSGTVQPISGVYGEPVLAGDLVLVTSFNNHLYAFRRDPSVAAADRLAWEFAAEGPIIGSAAVYDGVAYFGSSDKQVYAVDLNTGTAVWPKPFVTENWVWGAPAVDANRVYVGSMDRHVYAIDRATGQEVWQRDIGASVIGPVTLDNDKLFVGGVDQKLHAFDASTGDLLWTTPALGGWVWGESLAHEGYVYVNSLNGKLHAFAEADGAPRWEPTSVEGALRAGPVLLDGGMVVATDTGNMYTVDLQTGQPTPFFKAAAGILSRPAVVNRMIYAGTLTGNVYALDADRGTDPQVWVYPPASGK